MVKKLFKIHSEGHIFIILSVVITIIFYTFSSILGLIAFFATIFCISFFRDPGRVVPIDENIIVSPADGIIQSITEEYPPSELSLNSEKMTKISIFLSLFNVHVNRVPADGRILKLHYTPGKFLNASLDKASKDNERQSVLMEMKNGTQIVFVQIAGLIARRIICDLEEENTVAIGERYGIIRFGSRVDLYLPRNIPSLVSPGQTCVGGETIIAEINARRLSASEFRKL